ncbi:MAG: hypothetical protein KJ060_13295 [Candidatus Hydrogenedentes bacterium]|nr:hypothetical protein [Candidatus Hydrogenedentota bacterium]
MRAKVALYILLVLSLSLAHGGEIRDGVLIVDNRPFYPLGSWNFTTTTMEDIALLGMNTSFRGGPGTEEAVEEFRGFMRECDRRGIQVVPYLSYGGAGVTPWAPEAVRAIAKLASEPNLLTWYVGDDITMRHLEGIQQTVSILREETPTVPTVADYIADETPEAQTTFTQYVDIRCQYTYPIPDDPYTEYLAFFDKQRAFVGDPLWTWVQNFMWGHTGQFLSVGAEGPGPIPDPEQVRLLAFAAINRGVRGLLFFAHHELHRLPELAAEVALTCREIRLFEGHLAAGEPTFNLPCSDPGLNATAFAYGGSTVISAALFRDHYHQYLDEGIIEDVTITCPWSAETLPRATLVNVPDVVACEVNPGAEPGTISIRVPRLELAGFILVDPKEESIVRLEQRLEYIPEEMKSLIVPAAAAQTRKVCGVVWQLGLDNLYESETAVMETMRTQERCASEVVDGEYLDAFRAWRSTLRHCRGLLAMTMAFAEERREAIPASVQEYLISPYGLHKIPGLGDAPGNDEPWRFTREWLVTGPFPLEANLDDEHAMAPGFERAYAPESGDLKATFDTLDGPRSWHAAECDVSGLLDLRPLFDTIDNVVAYAACTLNAPQDGEAKLSIGSNDGARLWVNGDLVYSEHGPRSGTKHDAEVTVPVRQGANPILVKVENIGRNWKLYLSVHDPERAYTFSR